jgi:phage-related protein
MASPAPRKTSVVVKPAPRGPLRPMGPVRPAITGSAQPVSAGPAVKLSYAKAAKDPRFTKVIDNLQKNAARMRHHPPAARKAADAQAAAAAPANEKMAGAKAVQVGVMDKTETGKPKPATFLDLLRAEIEKVIPKKTEGVKDFMKGDDKRQLKDAMTGNVSAQKDQATGGLKSASDPRSLEPGKIPGKEVVSPMPVDPEPSAPSVKPTDAMPAPRQDSAVSLDQGKKEADKALTDNELNEPQLKEANDPRFSRVITAKKEVDSKAQSLPQKYRSDESGAIAGAGAKSVADEKRGVAGFHGERRKSGAKVKAHQMTAKERDEARRREVVNNIESIYNRTKSAVDKKLEGLEKEVGDTFDQGTEAALTKMRDYVDERFDDRYSGIIGKGRWLKDKLWPLPDSVKAWFEESRKVFTRELDALVVRVADLVERRLKEAKDEIAKGEKEVSDYVTSLPEDLKAVGKAAGKEVADRFAELRQGVEDKKQDLAQNLAQRYKEASDKGAAAMKEMIDAHKSLVEKVKEFVGEVIEVLRNFKNRLMSMLSKAKDAIGLIVAHPIKFLSNLLDALKQGLRQFVDRIWEHLKEGFIAWLFGSLAETGVTVPKDFSLPSILMLVLQVLGLTYDRLRAKAVKLIGERNVALIEKVFELLKALWDGGPAALWEKLKEFLSDLKEQVVDAIQQWVVSSIIKAAVTKLATMFNPVGAIIQAILMIYNTVMFFIENINRILDFVEAVIESVYKIATGAIGDAANWIEKALARTIPIIIGFLARLLGISGVADKIVSTVKKIQSKVDKAVDKVIEKVVGGIKKLVGAGKAAVASVLQWWRAGKTFTGGDGKPHTISVDRRDNRAVITVRSTERTLEEIIADQPEPKRKPLEAKYEKIKLLVGGAEPDEKEQDRRHREVQAIIDQIAVELGPGKCRPTVVTHATKSGERAHRIIADPLTAQAGNTKGQQAQGEILERALFWSFVRPVPQERTIGGKRVKLETLSMIRGTHLLAHTLHGPTERWNISNANTSINERMKGPEGKAKELTDRGFELRYVTTVDHWNDSGAPPAAEEAASSAASLADEVKIPRVRGWLGFHFARAFSVAVSVISAPAGADTPKPATYGPFASNIEADLPLRVGPSPQSLEDRVFEAAVSTATAKGRVIPYKELAKQIQLDNQKVLEILGALSRNGRLQRKGKYYYVDSKAVAESDS